MPTARLDGIELFYESCGTGTPLVFCHEYATDRRAWEAQVRHFSRRYRVVTFNYRGYPPSSVPTDDAAYAHDLLIGDLEGLFDALGIGRAHLVGLATGGNLALNFAIRRPERVLGLVPVGAGAGTSDRANWLAAAVALADRIVAEGSTAAVRAISQAPQRTIFAEKDPRGWQAFLAMIAQLDPVGAEKLMRVTLTGRLPVTALQAQIARLPMPVLVMMGDQDTPAHEAGRFIRDHAPHAGLAMLPMCGHTLNLEEPMLFNRLLEDFLSAVDAGRWGSWRAAAGGSPA